MQPETIKDLRAICLEHATQASATFTPQQTVTIPIEGLYTQPGELQLRVFVNLKPETAKNGKYDLADFAFRTTREGANLYAIFAREGEWITVSLHGPHLSSSLFMEKKGNDLFTTPNVARDLLETYAQNSGAINLKNPTSINNSSLDVLVSAGIPEDVLASNQELWDILARAERNTLPSANKLWYVQDQSGKEWVLKLYDKSVPENKQKARFAAAANYYLASHLKFIVPGKQPIPLESDQYFMVLQQRIPDKSNVNMPLDYWIATIAVFHREAAKILVENNIALVEKTPLRGVEFFQEEQKRTGGNISFDRTRLNDCIDYLARDHSAGESSHTPKTLIHRDLKADNLFGPYMLDLDNCTVGDPGIDLAILFAQYQVPPSRWEHYLGMYADVKGCSGSREMEIKKLSASVKHAAYYVLTKELLGSASRKITPQTAANNTLLHRARHTYSLAA